MLDMFGVQVLYHSRRNFDMYKINQNSTSITRLADGASIPADMGNTDYVAFLNWLSAGNAPEPADIPPPPTYQQLRAAAYPSIPDQLDTIFHGGIEGWMAEIQAVKDAYPKEQT